MTELSGWLLDLYAQPQGGLSLWLLGEDGQRHHLRQDFPVTFFAAGPPPRLRQLWRYLRSQPEPVTLARAERRDLFQPQPVTLLSIQAAQPAAQLHLFWRAAQAFPDLTFYDADLPLSLRHAACYGTFPLARCRVEADAGGRIQALETLDSPWELDPQSPPLRMLALEPDVDPFHAQPSHLVIRSPRASYCLSLEHPRPLLHNLRAILSEHDPDILLTNWGDTWLLPRLLELSQHWRIPLPLNRDPGLDILRKAERTYFSYGQVIHRGCQVHLFGRWHIDGCNAMLFHEYGLEGILELGRVTALSVQNVARQSPGTGISAMQIVTALRQGILVPWHKQQTERPRPASEMFYADQGGLVYQPTAGLHRLVAEIDFISMYPSIMRRFNISPETIEAQNQAFPNSKFEFRNLHCAQVPELDLWIDQERPGLVPQTLAPLLDKRLAFKHRLAELPAWDPRRLDYKARATAHKWLLVTCFGYLGYKNARFGRIEAHQAVTAYGREALLRAKEAAEDLGFSVLHMYVDGLWVQKDGADTPAAIQPLLEEITQRSGLPIALEGIYRWVAFLSSRVDARVPVANRYFGAYQDGSLKLRGIEARRGDTAPWIAALQMRILELLAQAPRAEALPDYLPAVRQLLRRARADLCLGKVPLEELIVSQKLSRNPDEYSSPSPPARAAAQLATVGKLLRAGQRVRFLYTLGEPGVWAWDLPDLPDRRTLDLQRYLELLHRAVEAILQPLGLAEEEVKERPLFTTRPVTFLPNPASGRISHPQGISQPQRLIPVAMG